MSYGEVDYEKIRQRVEKRLASRSEFLGHLLGFVIFQLVSWSIWAGGFTLGWSVPWPLLIALLWGGGLIAHGVETYMKSDMRPEAVNRSIDRQMTVLYGPHWIEVADEAALKRVRKSARQQIDQRVEFWQHLMVFFPMMLFFQILWLSGVTLGLGFSWVACVAGLWGFGLVTHGVQSLLPNNEGRIIREIEREMARSGKSKSKRKNEDMQPMRLTDDGELEFFAPDEDVEGQTKRSAQ